MSGIQVLQFFASLLSTTHLLKSTFWACVIPPCLRSHSSYIVEPEYKIKWQIAVCALYLSTVRNGPIRRRLKDKLPADPTQPYVAPSMRLERGLPSVRLVFRREILGWRMSYAAPCLPSLAACHCLAFLLFGPAYVAE